MESYFLKKAYVRSQKVFLLMPVIFTVSFLWAPAGLVVYWFVSNILAIGQQYLIAGWGSLFPLFGWTPAFARDHTPRFRLLHRTDLSPISMERVCQKDGHAVAWDDLADRLAEEARARTV